MASASNYQADQRAATAVMASNLYIGSFISIISLSEIRYEGFLCYLCPNGSKIGLRNVRFFGTEGRWKNGPQVSAGDKIFEYIYFRGSDIKGSKWLKGTDLPGLLDQVCAEYNIGSLWQPDLQVISSPLPQSTSVVPYDPAIIQSHFPHPTHTAMASTSHGAAKVANVSTRAQPILSVTPFQLNQPRDPSSSHCSFWGSLLPPPPTNVSRLPVPNYWPGLVGSSRGVSRFPPPPQSLVAASQPPVQQAQPQNVNTSVAGESSFFQRHPHLLLQRSTGSINTLPPLLPTPTVQSKQGSTRTLVNATRDQVTDEKITVEPTGEELSPMTIEEQSGPKQSSPSQSLQATNNDAETALAPVMEPLPSDSTEETPESLLKPTTKTGSTSSHHYKGQSSRGRDQVHRGPHQQRGGRSLGRANVANGVALYTHQSSRDHAVGKGDGFQPNSVPLHNPGYAGSSSWECGAKNPRVIRRFKEDFDFEAMNKKFNKKEVWEFFGKNKKAEADDGNEDDKKMDGDDVKGKAKEVHVKDDSKPVYCKDDFFDFLSYATSDYESEKVTLSEQRKKDDETFGVEIPILQQDHGQGSHSAGTSQASFGGRRHGNVRGSRGRGRKVWAPVAKR